MKKVPPQEEAAKEPSTTTQQTTAQTLNDQPEPTVNTREGLKILVEYVLSLSELCCESIRP